MDHQDRKITSPLYKSYASNYDSTLRSEGVASVSAARDASTDPDSGYEAFHEPSYASISSTIPCSTRKLLSVACDLWMRTDMNQSQDEGHRGQCTYVCMPSVTNPFTAHTISQRIRQLKKIPPELIPLGKLTMQMIGGTQAHMSSAGVVLGIAIGAAVWSMGHKLYIDKQLRLSRQGGKRH